MLEKAQKVKISYERKAQTLHSLFTLKFHNRDDLAKVEVIKKVLQKAGIEITLMAYDEKNGDKLLCGKKYLMKDYLFSSIMQYDCNIIALSEEDVDLGINAGFCYAVGKPIYVLAKTNSAIPTTMENIAKEIIFYNNPEDLVEPFTRIAKSFPRVILASKSAVRKQQLIDESIPFEIIVSNADETPNNSKSFKNQLAEISMRKAKTVFEETSDRGLRLIIAADQNIVFENVMYGKPKSIDDARNLIMKMMGSEEVYAYTGNSVLLAEGATVLQSINITDVARMSVDEIPNNELESYLANGKCLTYCGGISISNSNFIHLKEGRMSTARGMTLEYAKEMMSSLK